MIRRMSTTHAAGASSRTRGFTLVEILIVLTVMALLATLLLSALTRTREVARQSTCMSNLRQLGVALTLWRTDQFPQDPLIEGVSPVPRNLTPLYVTDRRIWVCPTDPKSVAPPELPLAPSGSFYTSYIIHYWRGLLDEPGTPGAGLTREWVEYYRVYGDRLPIFSCTHHFWLDRGHYPVLSVTLGGSVQKSMGLYQGFLDWIKE